MSTLVCTWKTPNMSLLEQKNVNGIINLRCHLWINLINMTLCLWHMWKRRRQQQKKQQHKKNLPKNLFAFQLPWHVLLFKIICNKKRTNVHKFNIQITQEHIWADHPGFDEIALLNVELLNNNKYLEFHIFIEEKKWKFYLFK